MKTHLHSRHHTPYRLFLALMLGCGLALSTWAQQGATLLITGSQSEDLTLTMDNVVVNTTPHKTIRLEGLAAGSHSLRVQGNVQGQSPRVATASVTLREGQEVRYNLQVMRGGQAALILASVATAPPPPATVATFHMAPAGNAWVIDNTVGVGMTMATTDPSAANVGMVVNDPTTGTVTSVGMTVGANGVGMQVQDGMGGNVQVGMAVTGTTTTSQVVTTTTAAPVGAVVYNGAGGCPQPMPEDLYRSTSYARVVAARLDATRLALARQEIAQNCMTADQIRRLVAIQTMERDKLDLAKYAYDFVFDCANYLVVMDAFALNGSARELEAYIASHPCGGGVPQQVIVNPQVQPQQQVIVQPALPPNPLPSYTGRIGCPAPTMDPGRFSAALSTVRGNSFASTQMDIAKQITGQNCLFVSQIQQIMDVFSFESSKVEYAKFAYTRCWDIDNYFQLTNGFTFESSKTDLMNFTAGQNIGQPNPWANPQQQMIITQPQQQQVVVHPRTGQTQVVVTQPQQQVVVTQPQPMMNTGTCIGQPMDPGQWQSFVASVNDNSFASTQKTMVRSTLGNRCIFTQQVSELLEIFTFESDQLEMAKFLYDRTIDKENYFSVANVFTFESSKTDLMNYISNRR
jgi:hypothetical protein